MTVPDGRWLPLADGIGPAASANAAFRLQRRATNFSMRRWRVAAALAALIVST
jgi:hypothetical protein